MPRTPLSKVRISPYWAWLSPVTVAISLSTVWTVPISSGTAASSQSSMDCCIRGSRSSFPGWICRR